MKSILIGLVIVGIGEVHCLNEINHDQPDHSLPNPHIIEDGKCPYQPGDIQSNVAATFDFHIMEGIWKVIFDEKTLNENFTCMGSKFMNVIDYDGHVLEFM